jgi:hypothetical protein
MKASVHHTRSAGVRVQKSQPRQRSSNPVSRKTIVVSDSASEIVSTARPAALHPRKARRWRPRFSLRALLLVVTVLCLALGWRLHRARQQREAVQAIRQAGGWVYYDYQQFNPQNGQLDLQAKPWQPAWLIEPVGIDFWRKVTALNMSFHEERGMRWDNEQPTTDIGRHLSHLPRLRFLGLTEHSVDDAGLQYVGQLQHLEVLLYWDAPGVTDAGARHLRNLPRLQCLNMGSSEIGDRGLEAFAQLPRLEELVMQGNNVTDKGLAALAGHRRLKSLWVGGDDQRASRITNAGVRHLATIASLEELDLQYSQVTLEGLKPLQKLPGLKSLYLHGSPADDFEAASAMFPKCFVDAEKETALAPPSVRT